MQRTMHDISHETTLHRWQCKKSDAQIRNYVKCYAKIKFFTDVFWIEDSIS